MNSSGLKLRLTISLCCLLAVVFFITSCSLIPNLFDKKKSSSKEQNSDSDESFSNIDTLFIQSFTGSRRDEVRDIFFKTIRDSGKYSTLELLPDTFDRLGVLRVKVIDFKVWETEEPLTADLTLLHVPFSSQAGDPDMTEDPEEITLLSQILDLIKKKKEVKPVKKSLTKTDKTEPSDQNKQAITSDEEKKDAPSKKIENIIRRNVLVSVQVSFFDASTGKVLVRGTFSQPFQQIYLTRQDIDNRIPIEDELLRVSRMLGGKLLREFESRQLKMDLLMPLEKGLGTDWISKNFYNFGNSRLTKGNRYAVAGEYEKAISVWKLIIFGSEETESQRIYLKNRASAFYNLGTVFQQQKDWWTASQMFSQANRLQQKMKYAQSWGDNVHRWLEEQKNPTKKALVIDEDEFLMRPKKKVVKKVRPTLIHTLENEDNLLLKPRVLWPLEPNLKNQKIYKSDSELLKIDNSTLEDGGSQTPNPSKGIKMEPIILDNP